MESQESTFSVLRHQEAWGCVLRGHHLLNIFLLVRVEGVTSAKLPEMCIGYCHLSYRYFEELEAGCEGRPVSVLGRPRGVLLGYSELDRTLPGSRKE